jgi:Leucine-rich repeat (LRR) protein
LFLSHNHLRDLEGVQVFKNLSHVSISHNKITDIEELSKIQSPEKLECLSIKGNFVDRHPDYKSLLIQHFPNLKELDSMKITSGIRT